ncbi:MAG: PorT family protein [Ignavibacteriae bacterium]|nr:PorT family protein [Ignavibacteriota bacterium]
MNTITLTITVFLLIICGVNQTSIAQTSNLTFGIRAGAGVSFLSENYTIYYNNRDPFELKGFSFNGGGIMSISLDNNSSIQPELHYSYESARYSEQFQRTYENGSLGEKVTFITKHSVASICVPILIKMSFGVPKAGQIGIYVGPNFGYTVSVKKVSWFNPAKANEENIITDLTDVANLFQIGAVVGGDIRILDNLFMDARFGYKFTKHIDTEIYHGSFSNILLGIGYMF